MQNALYIFRLAETSASRTPAHDVAVTVAPFQAWRGSQLIIAEEPTEVPIERMQLWVFFNRLASNNLVQDINLRVISLLVSNSVLNRDLRGIIF